MQDKGNTNAKNTLNSTLDTAKANVVIARINAIGEVNYPSSAATISKARELYNSLNDTQKGMVSNYSTLTKVVEVIEKIEAIGEYGFTAASKQEIDAAREAYDALTDAQKALVSEEKLAALEKAEKDYQELIDNNKLKILSISAEKMATDKI